MIEIGTVKEVSPSDGTVLVEFAHLETEATCSVVVPTAGSNAVFYLPAEGAQVACWLEGGKNIALGCIYSEADPVPSDTDENTHIQQFGKTTVAAKNDSWKVEQDAVSIELSANKMNLKNGSTNIKKLFKDILTAIKTLTVSTAVGPSGTPLPTTIQKITVLEQGVDSLLKE